MTSVDSAPSTRLALLRAAVQIAHHLPGRIRLSVRRELVFDRLIATPDDLQALLESPAAVPGMTSVTVNAAALSCTIHYDPSCIAPEHWTALIEDQVEVAPAPFRSLFTSSAPD
ncbi:MAG: hypothetical protein RLZZ216_53 [Cyanobacteriota bacterium]|jgi:hypothetical protein